MNPMTHPHPDSVETVQPFMISPSPRTGTVQMVGYITAVVCLVGIIWIPFGFLSLIRGTFLGPRDGNVQPTLLGILLLVEFLVACLGCTAGIAAVSGKIWSIFGIRLYAIFALILALVAIWPFAHYVPDSADTSEGIRHAMILLVVVKQWIVESTLAVAILYTFSRTPIERAFAHPVIETPDRSRR